MRGADWAMKLFALLLVAFAIVAVTGTAIALHSKPLNGHLRSVGRWISDLLSSAIGGAVAVLLLDLLASWIAPEYWGPRNSWNAAAAGAVGGMLAHCFKLIAPRKSKNSN
jgi:hypothetical protein